jgi:exosortase family protein XrtF
LKEYILQYKPFLLFLAKFFISYLVLAILYQLYLNGFDEKKMEVDGFTQLVANQSEKVISLFDDTTYVKPNLTEPCVNLFYKNKWVARIIEGCNALSIIILFISFVIAFSGKIKKTILFILVGIIIIHFFNIIRIAFLSMIMYHFPQYQDFLHSVVFPLFIYGIVFILWIIWVNKYSFYAEK